MIWLVVFLGALALTIVGVALTDHGNPFGPAAIYFGGLIIGAWLAPRA